MSEAGSPVQRVGASEPAAVRNLDALKVQPGSIAFGIFELDATTGELRKGGRLIHLRHQSVRVLRLLLERTGQMVTRAEITDTLWPDDEVDVDVEQGVNHCMREIRAALGDRPDSPRFIQTLPRRGYRFLMEVRDLAASRKTNAEPEPSSALAPTLRPVKLSQEDPDQTLSDGRFE